MSANPRRWDIFCNVVDNYGDIGVTWRLARQLVAEHQQGVRLWVDDLRAFVPLCPEVAIGLGIPRQPVRLVGNPAQPQAVGTVDSTLNVTQPLHDYGVEMAAAHTDICGYIFMQKSPSCGLERVKVYQDNGYPATEGGRGAYAAAFCAERPDLPVEEDGRLDRKSVV